jgi:hypothetical protein
MDITKRDQKILAIFTCYLSDITLMSWIYFKFTNYDNYAARAHGTVNSPDFQIQLYWVLVQSLTFSLLLFMLAQTVVYFLFWKNFRGAKLYLKFFAIFGAAVSFIITTMFSAYALLPFLIYCFGYYVFASTIRKKEELQTQSLPQ